MQKATDVAAGHPILIDKFLEDAIEVDVDALADGKECVIAGIMQHIEGAGIHSGDSACSLPTYSLSKKCLQQSETGESMGIADSFGIAFLKSQIASGYDIPTSGKVFISVTSKYIAPIISVSEQLRDLGFEILYSPKTHRLIGQSIGGADKHLKMKSRMIQLEKGTPNVPDYIKKGRINMIINICPDKASMFDEMKIRQLALVKNIPVITTLPGAIATNKALTDHISNKLEAQVIPCRNFTRFAYDLRIAFVVKILFIFPFLCTLKPRYSDNDFIAVIRSCAGNCPQDILPLIYIFFCPCEK